MTLELGLSVGAIDGEILPLGFWLGRVLGLIDKLGSRLGV